MVESDEYIKYLRNLVIFYSKENRILIHNLHVLKGYGAKN